MNALGIPAGEYDAAPLSRFAAPAGLNGLGASFWASASAALAEFKRAKIDALSALWGSTPSFSSEGSDVSLKVLSARDLPHLQQNFAFLGRSSPQSGH